MKTNVTLASGFRVGRYVLKGLLGRGGNGEVWRATNNNGTDIAIKFLIKMTKKSRLRFWDEIGVVSKNIDIDGILPILEYSSPTEETIPYYVMPLAKPLIDALKSMEVFEIVEYMCQVIQTLIHLHDRGISHRDIKPANLLFYKKRVYISDFGLADFPEKQDITAKNEAVGPRWTMAPEMRRDPKNADGLKADSYSFAKSLWIMLTKEYKGFDGQYLPNAELALKKYIPLLYYKGLDDLLTDCTSNNPDQRPTAKEIHESLLEWMKIEADFHTRNKLQWKDLQKKLFPLGTPTRAIWEQKETIVDILQQLSSTNDLNHMFFPTGGGMNLLGARPSYEEDCIELDVGWAIILKAKRLVFESFNFEEEWNYFRLETENLTPSGYYDEFAHQEHLTELKPLIYTDIMCWEFNDYNGEDLPQGARLIVRTLDEGSMVIFQNLSKYSSVGATYDARHNKMTTDEFRNYISKIVREISKNSNDHSKENGAITLMKPSLYKSKRRLLTGTEIAFLKEIISLAKDRELEEIEMSQKSGMGIFVDLLNTNFIFAPRPKSERLNEYLKKLSQEQLVFVAAVMYGGRSSSPPLWGTPLDELIDYFQGHSDIISSIREKLPLAGYIEKGIVIYS